MWRLTLTFILGLLPFVDTEETGPICYNCERTDNPELCRESITCDVGQVCSVQQVNAPHVQSYFWSGCESYEICEMLSEGMVYNTIIGKRQVSEVPTDAGRCAYCCTEDLCNKNCSAFVNLALHKPAFQSSTSYNGSAELAVDGNATKNYYAGSCTHTQYEKNPWWAVDLQAEYHITKVKLHERDDAYGDGRSFHLQVLVSFYNATLLDMDSPLFTVCGSYFGHSSEGNTITIDCPRNTTGRWVRVQQVYTQPEYFHLCEVEVFGF